MAAQKFPALVEGVCSQVLKAAATFREQSWPLLFMLVLSSPEVFSEIAVDLALLFIEAEHT